MSSCLHVTSCNGDRTKENTAHRYSDRNKVTAQNYLTNFKNEQTKQKERPLASAKPTPNTEREESQPE